MMDEDYFYLETITEPGGKSTVSVISKSLKKETTWGSSFLNVQLLLLRSSSLWASKSSVKLFVYLIFYLIIYFYM